MSDDRVALVRRFFDGWTRQDLDAVLDCVHDDLEFDWSASGSTWKGVYNGHEGLMRLWAEQVDAWEEFTIELADVIERPDGRLVTTNDIHARGKTSGVDVEARTANLWTFRDGRISHSKYFHSSDEALRAR